MGEDISKADEQVTKDKLKKYHFDSPEYDEERNEQWIYTDYPQPIKRYRVDYERYDLSLEESYFWVLNFLKVDAAFSRIYKLIDVFAAAEQSDFWGVAQQRLGLQQDRVSNFLATVGKMVKELFQLVRELRILDERLSYYDDSYTGSSTAKSAEITLKGIFIDLAEGGSKNPASVFGMARELQFVTLPDLFFDAPAGPAEELDKWADKLDFNESVKRVLLRKLRSFVEWKKSTHKELQSRRLFTLKYLRQHFDIIKMYMAWVRPYLKNIRRLTMSQTKVDQADIVSAFEGSMIEVEFLAKKVVEKNRYSAVVVANFDARTHPTMSFHQEGFAQRGPIHTGRIVINLRCYAWTDEQVNNYIKMRTDEDLSLLGDVDASVKAAMIALGDELMNYLREAGEEDVSSGEQKQKSAPRQSVADPFTAVFKGAAGMATAFFPGKSPQAKKPKVNKAVDDAQKKAAGDHARQMMWNCYKNYKNAHGMLAW